MTDENKKENSLISIGSNALVRVGNSIAITKKLLAEFDHKKNTLAQLKGKLKWKFKTEGEVSSSPAIMDSVVYFGSSDGNLYAVDSQTGQLKWKFKAESRVDSSPAMIDGVVYFGSYDKYFYAVDSRSGQLQWKFKTEGEVFSSPAIMNGVVYFGSWDKYLYAVE